MLGLERKKYVLAATTLSILYKKYFFVNKALKQSLVYAILILLPRVLLFRFEGGSQHSFSADRAPQQWLHFCMEKNKCANIEFMKD